MTRQHANELTVISQKICDYSTQKFTEYCVKKYTANNEDAMEDQLEDLLYVAQETSVYLLGNALALLEPDERKKEIRGFTENLQKVISYAVDKADN